MRLIGYHGTMHDFERFDLDRAGASGLAARGHGVHFWADIRLAESSAGDAGRIIEAEIALRNPVTLPESETPGQEATPADGPEIVVFDLTCIRIVSPAMTRTQRLNARQK